MTTNTTSPRPCDCCGERAAVTLSQMWGPRCGACPVDCDGGSHRRQVISARVTGHRVLGCYRDGTPYEWHFMPADAPPDGPTAA